MNVFDKLTKNPNLKKIGKGGGDGFSEHTFTNIPNDTSTLQGENLCQIIL